MSNVTYRYNQSYSFKKKGIKHTIKETLIDGTDGLTISFLQKTGDDKFYKFYIKEIKKGEFELKEKIDDKDQAPKMVSEKDVIKMLKDNKLETIINYINKERGTYKGKVVDLVGGRKKRTKKASKKTSKKASKKTS